MSRNRTKRPHDMDVSYQSLTTIRDTLDVCADFAFSPAAVLDLGASMALLEWHRPRRASRAILAAAERARRGRTTVAWPLHGSLCAGLQGWRCSRCLQTMTCSTARQFPALQYHFYISTF